MQRTLLRLLENGGIGAEAILAQLDNVRAVSQLTEFVADSLIQMGIDRAAPLLPKTINEARDRAAKYISSCRESYLDAQMPEESANMFNRLEAWDPDKGELKGHRITGLAKLLFPGLETIEAKDIRGKDFVTIDRMRNLYLGWHSAFKKGHYYMEKQKTRNYLGGLALAPEDDVLIRGNNDKPLKVWDIIKFREVSPGRYTLVFHREYIPQLIERDLRIKLAPLRLPEGYVPLETFVKCEFFGRQENSSFTWRIYYRGCEAVLEKLKEEGQDIRIGRSLRSTRRKLYQDQRGVDLFFHHSLLPRVKEAMREIKFERPTVHPITSKVRHQLSVRGR